MSKGQFRKAIEAVLDAEASLADGSYENAAGRAYYAMFHAAQALLQDRDPGFDAHSHRGVLSEFSRRFVKTDQLPATFGEIINRAQVNRHAADYDADPVDHAKTEKSVREARMVVEAIRPMLKPESRVEWPKDTTRQQRLEAQREGAAKAALVDMLAPRLSIIGETMPDATKEELALYASLDDLREFAARFDDGQPWGDQVRQSFSLPSLGFS